MWSKTPSKYGMVPPISLPKILDIFISMKNISRKVIQFGMMDFFSFFVSDFLSLSIVPSKSVLIIKGFFFTSQFTIEQILFPSTQLMRNFIVLFNEIIRSLPEGRCTRKECLMSGAYVRSVGIYCSDVSPFLNCKTTPHYQRAEKTKALVSLES